MVLELRGRLWIYRPRRERTSQRGSVLALLKAAVREGAAKQGGTTAFLRSSLRHFASGAFLLPPVL